MAKKPNGNVLYYGDNLGILRDYIADESIDLVYLDPPFKSNRDYNLLFAEQSGARAAAQIKAFEDTWRWDRAAVETFESVVEEGGRVADVMRAFRMFLTGNDVLAYLSMMAPRLKELHRVLKPTGSIYLHCDPAASHYLKVLMDAVFEPTNFKSEIIWRRTGAHGKSRRFSPIHDIVLFYSKSDEFKWNWPKKPYMRGHVDEHLVQDADGWRTDYYGNVLTGSGLRGGESGQPWQGIDPSAKGRHWAVPGAVLDEIDEDLSGLTQHQKLDRLYDLGYITIVPGEAWPIYNHRVDPAHGQAVPDIWAFQPYTGGTVFGTDEGIDEDVRWLAPRDQERLGYPTQKPEGLLERIIAASSDEGDTVLDPFCGCGTTVSVAQRMRRRWLGIDITHLAIGLIKYRLSARYSGTDFSPEYSVVGEPVSVPDAEELASDDPFQFQAWALGLVDARQEKGKPAAKGADRGIDGRLNFFEETGGDSKQIVISVKGGGVDAKDVRDLRGVVEREEAAIGVLITLRDPTAPMRKEAANAGMFASKVVGQKFPKLQILTVADLLDGRKIEYPGRATNVTFRRATTYKSKQAAPAPAATLFDETDGGSQEVRPKIPPKVAPVRARPVVKKYQPKAAKARPDRKPKK